MTVLRVLRVFLGPGGRGGNPLGVIVEGAAVPEERRADVAASLGFSETVFVESLEERAASIRIFTPSTELRFAGHPTVGTSWLLRALGSPVDRLTTAAGEVRTWLDAEDGSTWVRARPEWGPTYRLVEYATGSDVDALDPPLLGDPGYYAWAWLDAGAGELRARSFPTDIGISEDEATGAAAIQLGARLGRPLRIRQGKGSEMLVRPGPGGTVELGGRCGFLEERALEG